MSSGNLPADGARLSGSSRVVARNLQDGPEDNGIHSQAMRTADHGKAESRRDFSDWIVVGT